MQFKSALAATALGLGLSAFAVPAQAQISRNIKITISHPWLVGNKTMPAGTYVFQMSEGSQQQQMSCTNAKTGEKAMFVVESSTRNTRPDHSELVFDRIGKKEFLSRIFQSGARIGVAVEPSKEEDRLQKQGQKPVHDIASE